MKATELMIGDWVNVRGRFVCAIEDGNALCGKISDFETRAKKINCLTDKAIYVDAHTDGEIIFEPIPLTPEILEKNGFVANYAPEDYRYEDEILLTQSYDKQGYWWVIGNMYGCQFYYVHELQHVLRLCRLNDLADNFKID